MVNEDYWIVSRILDIAETERAAGFWLKNIKKAQLVIIDEIGYTLISRR